MQLWSAGAYVRQDAQKVLPFIGTVLENYCFPIVDSGYISHAVLRLFFFVPTFCTKKTGVQYLATVGCKFPQFWQFYSIPEPESLAGIQRRPFQ